VKREKTVGRIEDSSALLPGGTFSLQFNPKGNIEKLISPAFEPARWSLLNSGELENVKNKLYAYAILGTRSTIAKDITDYLVEFVKSRPNLVLEFREKDKTFDRFSSKFDLSLREYNQAVINGESNPASNWKHFSSIYSFF
jgi:hypothetical protein